VKLEPEFRFTKPAVGHQAGLYHTFYVVIFRFLDHVTIVFTLLRTWESFVIKVRDD